MPQFESVAKWLLVGIFVAAMTFGIFVIAVTPSDQYQVVDHR